MYYLEREYNRGSHIVSICTRILKCCLDLAEAGSVCLPVVKTSEQRSTEEQPSSSRYEI